MVKDILIERLTTYAQMDTQSDENSETCPSTPGQLALGEYLVGNARPLVYRM